MSLIDVLKSELEKSQQQISELYVKIWEAEANFRFSNNPKYIGRAYKTKILNHDKKEHFYYVKKLDNNGHLICVECFNGGKTRLLTDSEPYIRLNAETEDEILKYLVEISLDEYNIYYNKTLELLKIN